MRIRKIITKSKENNMAFKTIYDFTVYRTKEVDVTIENEDGSKTIKKEVQKVSYKIILKRPNRHESEEANLQYSIKFNELVKRGVMPRRLMEKEFGNNNGVFSEPEKERLSAAYTALVKLREEYQTLSVKEHKTKKDKEKIKQVEADFRVAQRELQKLENLEQNAYSNTAESRSMIHTIVFMSVFLTYVSEGNEEPKILLPGKTLEDKLDFYEKVTEDDKSEDAKFYTEAYQKAGLFMGLFVQNNFDTEDFKAIEKDLEGTPDIGITTDVEGAPEDRV